MNEGFKASSSFITIRKLEKIGEVGTQIIKKSVEATFFALAGLSIGFLEVIGFINTSINSRF